MYVGGAYEIDRYGSGLGMVVIIGCSWHDYVDFDDNSEYIKEVISGGIIYVPYLNWLKRKRIGEDFFG